MGRDTTQIDAVLDLIDGIYGTANAPEGVHAVLQRLSDCLGGHASQIYTWRTATGAIVDSQTTAVLSPKDNRAFVDHYGQIDPRRQAIADMPGGSTIVCHRLCDEDFVERSEFYQDFLIPAGIRWCVGTKFEAGDDTTTTIASLRTPDQPAFEDATERLLGRLVTHFQRAAWIRHQLLPAANARPRIEGFMDRLPVPCWLIDERGRILHGNPAANLHPPSHALRVRPHGLSFADPRLDGRWRKCLREVAALSVSASVELDSGTGSRLHLTPVRALAGASDSRDERLLLAVLDERGAGPEAAAVGAFARQHELSPAESEVLAALMAGEPLKRIAQRRGVSYNTVRSQVASIYTKAGVHAQRELLAAVRRVPGRA